MGRRALLLAGFLALFLESAATADPLPFRPSLVRVRVEPSAKGVLVVHEVALPRGAFAGGDLALYASFGAPGLPLAVDARLVPLGEGEIEPAASADGAPLPVTRATVRPDGAAILLGPPQMAGVVVTIPAAAFDAATSRGGKMAALRLRTLVRPPREDRDGAREIVVRLGAPDGAPIVLGRIVVAAPRAEARLVGPNADPRPLAISRAAVPAVGAIAPVLATRSADDDLAVRYWLK